MRQPVLTNTESSTSNDDPLAIQFSEKSKVRKATNPGHAILIAGRSSGGWRRKCSALSFSLTDDDHDMQIEWHRGEEEAIQAQAHTLRLILDFQLATMASQDDTRRNEGKQ